MRTRLTVLVSALNLTVLAAALPAAGQCNFPCVTMEQLEGRWDVLGYFDDSGYYPWHVPEANVDFRTDPDIVVGYIDEMETNDTSPVTLDCSAIMADPGINKMFGPIRPETNYGTGCVEFRDEGLTESEDGVDCAAPCLFIHSRSLYEHTLFFVYQHHTSAVPVETTAWAALKALYSD